MRILVAWLRGERRVKSTSVIVLVQRVVVALGEADAVAAEEASGSDVGGAFGEDAAGVVGKGVVPFGLEAFAEAPEVGDEEGEGFVVFFGFEVHAPFLEGGVEVVAGEGFGVSDLVVGVAVGSEGEGLAEEAAGHWLVSRMRWSGAMVTATADLMFLVSR
jgi:hypothetical protein